VPAVGCLVGAVLSALRKPTIFQLVVFRIVRT
jgi:hypothetical protein